MVVVMQKLQREELKRIIIQCTKEHHRTKNENIMYLSYGYLKVARDDANLVSLFSAFHNFAQRYENAFWPVLVLSRGTEANFVNNRSSVLFTYDVISVESESSISTASSDDNGRGRVLLWRKQHPRFFLATIIYFRQNSIFFTTM